MKNATSYSHYHQTPLRSFVLRYLLPLLAVGVIGATALPQPFHGDQALYQLGARILAEGGALYRDHWDLKKPSIYGFHWLAGTLFGFSQCSVRLLELILMLLLSGLMIRELRLYFHLPWMSSLTPFVTVGAYYLTADTWHLSQLSILASIPLFLSLWLMARTGLLRLWQSKSPQSPLSDSQSRPSSLSDSQSRPFSLSDSQSRPFPLSDSQSRPSPWVESSMALVAGLCAGITISFKFVYVLMILCGWVFGGVVTSRAMSVSFLSIVRRQWLPALLGITLWLSLVITWMWSRGSLADFGWTMFSFPSEAILLVGTHHLGKLFASAKWYLLAFAPWICLAPVAFFPWHRHARNPGNLLWLLWLLSGTIAIYLENFAWWPFDFLLLVFPTGILALRGLDNILSCRFLTRFRFSRSLLASLLVMVSLLYPISSHVDKFSALSSLIMNPTSAQLLTYRRTIDPNTNQIWKATRFLLKPQALPGPIYVFGDPLYLLLSKRRQAISLNGWAWSVSTRSQWKQLPHQLCLKQPVYIFIASYFKELIQRRSPMTLHLLRRNYTLIRRSQEGVWLRKNKLTPCDDRLLLQKSQK